MSLLLVVLPDSAHAGVLQMALEARVPDEIVVAGSLDEGLTSIDLNIPDVVLLPTLAPAVEDYLLAYLATIPGARHVQILGIPRLAIPNPENDTIVQPRVRSPLLWRRRQAAPVVEPPACDPHVFAEDVVAYLARARELRTALRRSLPNAERNRSIERRTDPRFANHQVPWITLVRLGDEQAVLLDVSSRGALLRTERRPEHDLLRRAESRARTRARLTLKLGSDGEVHAAGRIIRCMPSTAGPRTQYDVAFSFDESVGLHLPAASALIQATAADDEFQVVRAGPRDSSR